MSLDDAKDRDRRILSHVARYRITTNEALLRLFFADAGPDALKAVRKRLVGMYLTSRPLGTGRRVYYQLTAKAARMLREPVEVARPLGVQALPRAYAVLAFCCLNGAFRVRLNRQELAEEFPAFVAANATKHADFYLAEEFGEPPPLTRIVVDYGADYQAVLRKCRDLIRTLAERVSEFPALATAGLFAIRILTADELKARGDKRRDCRRTIFRSLWRSRDF